MQRRSRQSSFISSCGGLALSVALACAATPPGASDADLAQANDRASVGAAAFEGTCAGCHGPRGEGLAGAPPIIGITGLPRYPRDQSGVQLYQDPEQIQRQAQLRVPGASSRPEFVTALDLHNYLKVHMSTVQRPANVRDLTEEELWGVLEFMLIAHGSPVPQAGLSAENAASVQIRAQ